MSYSQTQYLDFLDAVKNYYGSGSDEWVEIAKYGLKADNAVELLKQVPGVDILKNSDGSIRSIAYKNFSTKGNRGTFLAESIDSNVIGGSANVKNSFNMSVPSNSKINTLTGNLETVSEIGTKVSTGQKVVGVLGNIGQAVLAVGTACTLGKTIDKALYNLNPDFWNAHDMSTLNPDTWASITNSGSLGDNIFNMLMGVDSETNETTAYIDQNALAYMAWYLQTKGIFNDEIIYNVDESKLTDDYNDLKASLKSSIQAVKTNIATIITEDSLYWGAGSSSAHIMYSLKKLPFNGVYNVTMLDDNGVFNYWYASSFSKTPPTNGVSDLARQSQRYNNKSWNYASPSLGTSIKNFNSTVPIIELTDDSSVILSKLNYLLLYESDEKSNAPDGVGNQPNAIIPDLSNANSIDDVLDALKTSNPSLFDNAITNSVPQEDGSIKNYTYLPFTLPNTNNANDSEPETGDQTQGNPQITPETSPDTLLDLITGLIDNKLDTPNTPNKGEGSTPSTTTPVGTASALYKIYNPSQEELNSFGTWLWSSNFVDQLLKVFNNPMESIIGLHKVYASPIIGGQTNIKVGYLDSGVSSNWVSNQYTKIDCGTVNLQEYFGNVFDYAPYTNIELYLPCIGFVNLNVGDVMRSKMNITYTVDVLTGSCLAEISINRDGGGGVLYSYSGNCASQYPLSSGSYMGIVSSAIGITGSIIGTVASGGSLAPLALGSVGSALNAHTSVQHSGSLSGNSGVMGGKIPYLIITRPQTNMANNYEHLQGTPSNYYVQLSSCHGFTQVKNVNVQNINAESEELDQIKTLLMEGVLI